MLTLRDNFYRVQDRGLLQDIPPEAVIHRTFALDSSRHLAIKGRHLAAFYGSRSFCDLVAFWRGAWVSKSFVNGPFVRYIRQAHHRRHTS